MRKAVFRGTAEEGRALFARAGVVHVATTGADGAPILRTLNAVLDGDAIAFHGAPAGEKTSALGRAAVVSASETVASIPSWFVDPERACPATTYYVSAQAHGTIEPVGDPADKARILSLFMRKYQPEGGYAPIDETSPLYAKALRGLLVARVRIEHLACKAKLGQNRTPAERTRILEHLWRRGRPEDVAAISTILAHGPELPAPSFLRAPEGSGMTLDCHASGADLDDAAALLEGAYWLGGYDRDAIRAVLARSTAFACARDETGALAGFARAVSDGRVAWIYDVVVREDARGTGVGRQVMRLLLDHPAVRSARHVRLSTRDAMGFYRRLGFVELADAPRHPWPTVDMVRRPQQAAPDQNERLNAPPA